MKYLHWVVLFVAMTGLAGCAPAVVPEEAETAEYVDTVTPEEFLDNAISVYRDEIGSTEPGKRIVVRYDKPDAADYSVYIFDDEGFTHIYYFFAYDDLAYLDNQEVRLAGVDYDRETVLVDDVCHMVCFTGRYVNTGSNSYNYFRDVLLRQTAGGSAETIYENVFEGYNCSIIGDMVEYVPEMPEPEIDEEGYVLCDNSDNRWSYIVNGDGEAILVGYVCRVPGSKLIIPSEVDGKAVCEVRQLEAVEGVTCVEVSEGVTGLQDSFKGWKDLNRLILHDGLLSITKDTLKDTDVHEIVLPETMQEVEDGFFAGFHVGDVTDIYWDTERLSGYYQGSDITSIIIPSKIGIVCSSAFKDCAGLAVVVIEDGCSVIESEAFTGAPNLQAVSLPETVTYIGEHAFEKETLLIVKEGSYAAGYAEKHGYTYAYQ